MGVVDDLVVRIRATNLSWREVHGQVVALDLESSTYFTTNKTGTLLWRAMVDGSTVAALIALLSARFQLSYNDSAADVRDFLEVLAANGLLEESD